MLLLFCITEERKREKERPSVCFALLYQQVKFLSQPHTRTFTYQQLVRSGEQCLFLSLIPAKPKRKRKVKRDKKKKKKPEKRKLSVK